MTAVIVPPEVLERRRSIKRLSEFDETIYFLGIRRDAAQKALDDAETAKRSYVDSLPLTLFRLP